MNQVTLTTDGACIGNPGPGGWAYILRYGEHVVERGGKEPAKTTNNRMMQEHGIRARCKRRFRVTTTDSRHDLPIAPNLLNRNFTASAPNRAWAGV